MRAYSEDLRRKIDETAKNLLEEDVGERLAATVEQRRRFLERASRARLSVTLPSGGAIEGSGLQPKKGAWGHWNETSG